MPYSRRLHPIHWWPAWWPRWRRRTAWSPWSSALGASGTRRTCNTSRARSSRCSTNPVEERQTEGEDLGKLIRTYLLGIITETLLRSTKPETTNSSSVWLSRESSSVWAKRCILRTQWLLTFNHQILIVPSSSRSECFRCNKIPTWTNYMELDSVAVCI